MIRPKDRLQTFLRTFDLRETMMPRAKSACRRRPPSPSAEVEASLPASPSDRGRLSDPAPLAKRGRRPRTLLACLLAFALSLLLSACSGEPGEGEASGDEVAVTDLVTAFEGAEVFRPTTEIDFGHPSSRSHLVSGWSEASRVSKTDPGRRATWSMGARAEIEIFADQPTDLDVSLRVRKQDEGAGDYMDLDVNGEPWARVELEQTFARRNLELPATLLRPGANRIGITHAPRLDGGKSRLKDFRVTWDRIRFSGWKVPETTPMVRADRGILFMPFGTRIDYHLDLPPGTVLEAERARVRGSVPGRLEVVWTPVGREAGDESGEITTRDLTAAPGRRVRLGEGAGRLSLVAATGQAVIGNADDELSAGVLLHSPRLLTAEAHDSGSSEPAPRLVEGPAFGAEPPNVLIYLIDTLRSAQLGSYGYERPTSPNIDALAAEGVLFENAQAQSPWTRASVASIFTGRWPQSHGANDQDDVLVESLPTLAEMLGETGYATAAVSANINASGTYGFDRGFEYFKQLRHLRPNEPLARSTDVHAATVEWLDQHQASGGDRPFFLWVHAIDPHAPYEAPEPFHSQFAAGVDRQLGQVAKVEELARSKEPVDPQIVEDLIRLYDAEVASNDHSFGLLMDELKARGLYENTLVVVVSDHGEEFYEHGGWTHGKTLYTEVLDVPLIVKPPGPPVGRRVSAMAQQVDLMPTVLEAAGLGAPESIQGISLVPWLAADGPVDTAAHTAAHTAGADERVSVSYMKLRGRHGISYLDSRWKLIRMGDGEAAGFPRLYDRRGDRLEASDLAAERLDLARYLSSRLSTLDQQGEAGAVESQTISTEDEQLLEELRALGYIQ